MRIRAGYRLAFDCPHPTPMLLVLSIHPSRRADLLTDDVPAFDPPLEAWGYIDGFGNAWSVGCVNLTSADARWIYDFATPVIPVGWLELRVPEGQGTPIRVRSAKDPEPKWLDWHGKPIKQVAAK